MFQFAFFVEFYCGVFWISKCFFLNLCLTFFFDFDEIIYILEEITTYILLIRYKLYSAAAIAYNLWKKVQMYQLSFYNYHLVYILATVWDWFQQREAYLSSNSITWNQLWNVSPFRYQLYQTQVKLLELSYHTAADWKPQRCKCSKVKLKNTFIVRSLFFLFIHNMALLLELVTTTTDVEVENP